MSNTNLYRIHRRPYPVAFLYFGIIATLLTAWAPALTGFRVGEPLLDALLLITSLLLLWRYGARKGALLGYQLFWMAYLGAGAVLAVWIRGVHPLDFAQAYKFVWYLVLLVPFSWARLQVRQEDFRTLLNVALFMFFSVYLCKSLLGDDRPKLMTENNFEMVFLALLYFSGHVAGNRPTTVQTIIFLAVVVLSGSRSAAVASALVILFSFDFKSRNAARVLGGLLTGIVGMVLALLIFENRSQGGLQSIDRFKFLMMFVESIRDWTVMDYVLGADRLTTLPPAVCSQLAYYSVLNSYDDNGTCYSVILHSFNLRILHDHGILITLLTLAFLFRLTRAAPIYQRLCVVAVILSSGFSVSALNNVFAALGIGLFCLAASTANSNLATRPAHSSTRQQSQAQHSPTFATR